MTAHAEGTCTATTKAGTRCKKPAVERGLCVFHSGRLDLAELGRQGGKARARKAEPQTRSERLKDLSWKAMEDLLASDAPATARVRAASELLDRLEPLLKRDEAQRQRELARQYEDALVGARARLLKALEGRNRVRHEQARRAFEDVLDELDRVEVIEDVQPIITYMEVDAKAALRGLVEQGLIVPTGAVDWRHGGWTLEELRERREQLAAELEELDAEIVERPVSG